MSHLGRSATVVAFWLVLAGRVVADAPEVKDEAKYFSADAIKQANEMIREIYAKSERDLLIETYATVPGDDDEREKVRKMSADEKRDYFRKWAEKRTDAAVVKGIYILICKDPPQLQIKITKKALPVFHDRAGARLYKIMLDSFNAKKFDEGLLAGVKYVRDSFAAGRANVAAEVKDDGKYFTPEGIQKANEIINEISTKYQKDLVIETFASVPGDEAEKEKIRGLSGEDKAAYFRKWAEKRAEALKVNGVYILLCKDPRYLRIEVTNKARSVFDRKAVAKLRDAMFAEFRDQRFDEGLLAGAKVVRDTFAAAK
jgi:uncharacterized membrane protein YgcG